MMIWKFERGSNQQRQWLQIKRLFKGLQYAGRRVPGGLELSLDEELGYYGSSREHRRETIGHITPSQALRHVHKDDFRRAIEDYMYGSVRSNVVEFASLEDFYAGTLLLSTNRDTNFYLAYLSAKEEGI